MASSLSLADTVAKGQNPAILPKYGPLAHYLDVQWFSSGSVLGAMLWAGDGEFLRGDADADARWFPWIHVSVERWEKSFAFRVDSFPPGLD